MIDIDQSLYIVSFCDDKKMNRFEDLDLNVKAISL